MTPALFKEKEHDFRIGIAAFFNDSDAVLAMRAVNNQAVISISFKVPQYAAANHLARQLTLENINKVASVVGMAEVSIAAPPTVLESSGAARLAPTLLALCAFAALCGLRESACHNR